MANFAQLDENNIVVQVIVVNNDELLENGIESENKGIRFCQSLFGINTVWKQTSYNGNFRKTLASVGFFYDLQKDVFISPKPYASWTLNNDTCDWQAPIPYPDGGKAYFWDDLNNNWIEIGKDLATPIETL